MVYILKCSDGSYYTGLTSDLIKRLDQHYSGYYPQCYTYKRRPLKLVHVTYCSSFDEAERLEKQIKKWSRKKKEALINDNIELLKKFSKNYTQYGKPDSPHF